jgi:uncharacterized protein YndB with AHSA1/START domain
MDKPSFVYVTYINSTRERVWQALTDGALTSQYWFGHRIESDWTVGAPLKFYEDGRQVHDDRILTCEPPALLSYTWHSLLKDFENEPVSRVTFTLEEAGDQVKLTMVHDEFGDGGKMLRAVSQGWPAVLSSLKSLLETGSPLKIPRPRRPPE